MLFLIHWFRDYPFKVHLLKSKSNSVYCGLLPRKSAKNCSYFTIRWIRCPSEILEWTSHYATKAHSRQLHPAAVSSAGRRHRKFYIHSKSCLWFEPTFFRLPCPETATTSFCSVWICVSHYPHPLLLLFTLSPYPTEQPQVWSSHARQLRRIW